MTKHTMDCLDEFQVRSRFAKMGSDYKRGRNITLPETGLLAEKDACVLAGEALCQGLYHFDKHLLKGWNREDLFYRREELSSFYENEIPNVLGTSQQIADFYEGFSLGKYVGFARTLGNLPANFLGVQDMIRYAELLAEDLDLDLTVLREEELKELSCNGILSVNKGSDKEPAVIMLRYCGDKSQPLTALIGKGVMFDTGGLHLKDMDSMYGMKYDMCGSATILETVEYLRQSKKKCNVVAILPLVENSVGSRATRPGDVIETMSGKTVEILNTDAEGRLILCDAITLAQREGAKTIIDLATLTNSCREALGDYVTGVFCNDDEAFENFYEASKKAGEMVWRLPLLPPYRELVKKSNVADLINYAPSMGAGASFAACFLEEFVPKGTTWIHLDCVGPAVLKEDKDGLEMGATGVMASSIIKYLEMTM